MVAIKGYYGQGSAIEYAQREVDTVNALRELDKLVEDTEAGIGSLRGLAILEKVNKINRKTMELEFSPYFNRQSPDYRAVKNKAYRLSNKIFKRGLNIMKFLNEDFEEEK